MCVRVYVYIYECSWIDSLKFVYYSWRVISIFQTYFLFIRSLSRFPTQQLISLRFRNIYLYRRKGAGKFQFLSVLFFFKQEGQEGKFSYFTATMFTGEEWNDFRVIRREAHTSSTLSLNPGFVLLYANQSTPTYVALRVLSSSLRGWFLARTEIACNLRSEFLSRPSPCSSLHAPGVHVHPGRSDVSLTLIQRW